MGDMSTIGAYQSPSQIMVAVRLRPLLATDRPHEMICAQALPYTQQVVLGHNCYQFQMDSSFSMDATQSQVFDTAIAPLMERLLQGYDISVVAYGQSKGGKTHTMLGPGVNRCHVSEAEYGIIPRAARYVFTRIKQDHPKKVKITISFLEVQNEKVRDLLVSSQPQQELTVLESDAGYPVVTGLQEVVCESVFDLFNWLQMGMENRHLGWNNARVAGHPSQSHSVFTLHLEQQWVTPEGTIEQRLSVAKFSDLASSEKIFYKGMNGEIIGEPVHMDPGLIALSNVVGSISHLSPWPNSSLPTELYLYRQSKLTKILKESFGGRCFSLVICCISPASLNFDESLMTLRFAEKLRSIRNYPVLNALSLKVDPRRAALEASKQNAHGDVITGEGTAADVFGLEFAATQWMKLVDSAEGLFNRLVKNNSLNEREKDEIEKWLCLKHECEECVGSEDAASVAGNECRLLEKIDEVTETEEKTDSSKELAYGAVHREENSQYESESGSEGDFADLLQRFLEEFKMKTDGAVSDRKDLFEARSTTEETMKREEASETQPKPQQTVQSYFPSTARRRSIHPGTQIPLIALPLSNENQSFNSEITVENNDEMDVKLDERQDKTLNEETNLGLRAEDQCTNISKDTKLEPQHELKRLTAENEEKQNKIKQVIKELESAQKRKQELYATIQIKEQFIQDMNNNADTRTNARQCFQRKKTKLFKDYYEARAQAEQARSALHQAIQPSEEYAKCKKEVEKYEKRASKYEKLIKNMDIMNRIAGESAKKVLELEQSLQRSRRQMEKLKQRLKKEELHKKSLESELERDQQKLHELKEKYDSQAFQLEERDRNESTEGKEGSVNWFKDEKEHFSNESIPLQQEMHSRPKSNVDKRGSLLKEKICHDKQMQRTIMERSARLSHFDHVLKEKSTDLENMKNEDEREVLRREIYNWRSARDLLVGNKCELYGKFQKEKTLPIDEERKLFEWDEEIAAIDTIIEYKNELICGKKGGLDDIGREKGEAMLMARLNKLSPMEVRMLFYKYFQKVIDLRESGRKLDAQLTEKEHLTDTQTYVIKQLESSLQHQKLQAEKIIVDLERQHQERLHLVLRRFAEESSAGGTSSGGETSDYHQHRVERYENTLKIENRRLKQKLVELESAIAKMQSGRKSGAISHYHHPHKDPRSRSVSPEPIPKTSLKQLKAAATSLTTKVTRQKNKLIIQQQKPSTGYTKPSHS